MSACVERREPGRGDLIGKEIGMTIGEMYLSKSAFSDTSEKHEMEEVDIGVEIDDL